MRRKIIFLLSGLSVLTILIILSTPRSIDDVHDRPSIPNEDARLPEDTLAIGTLDVPVSRPGDRITRKPFGIFIEPRTSPVQPERFSGYHTGTDFEIFSAEVEPDVPVRAVADGKILEKRLSGGYGGVLVTSGMWRGEQVTIVYGHLRLTSIGPAIGDSVYLGQTVGVLGTGFSKETDGERKHLHLAIHRGNSVNLRGYVATRELLEAWINPCPEACGN